MPAVPGAQAASLPDVETPRYLAAVRAPSGLVPPQGARPVVVAIVDDGVRLTHRALAASIWTNPREVPGNRVDDDGNGFVDDVHGWDVSDGDSGVAPPEDRLDEYGHGTHLAGIVARIARQAYGDRAPDLVRILPVKALADDADRAYLRDGYEGIRYAVAAGADVVLCAWSVGHISPREEAVLREAGARGVLVVASAGNFAGAREQFPAAHESVLAVAALDGDGRKADRSNHGGFVDLSAPGVDVPSAGARSDVDTVRRDGTSPAAAMVAAAAALVRVQHPSHATEQVIACLKSSAETVDALNPRLVAQLGAGMLDAGAAVECRLLAEGAEPRGPLRNPQGYLHHPGGGRPAAWTVRPEGRFRGLRFRLRPLGGALGGALRFYTEDPSTGARLVARHALGDLPESVFVAGTIGHVVFDPEAAGAGSEWLLEYRAEPIDFSRIYCSGTRRLDTEGEIADGSGPEPYAANSDCKWLITAPEGKVVHFAFSEFDTEARVDQVLFFDGAGTHERVMARFSGSSLPPELTTWRNQVLVWFVTDGEREGQGWRATYRFRDP